MESTREYGTSLNNRATLVQFKLAELRSDKPFSMVQAGRD